MAAVGVKLEPQPPSNQAQLGAALFPLLYSVCEGATGFLTYDDRVQIDWPEAAKQKVFERIEEKLVEVATANSATFIRNPIQNTFLSSTLVSVHPLGGCGMGQDRASGVTDHKCRVYDGAAGAAPGGEGARQPAEVGTVETSEGGEVHTRTGAIPEGEGGRDHGPLAIGEAGAPLRCIPGRIRRPTRGRCPPDPGAELGTEEQREGSSFTHRAPALPDAAESSAARTSRPRARARRSTAARDTRP